MAGIYVSWPFCAQKCTFCNFASGVQPRELEGRYLTALLREIRSREWPWQPDTLYFGGGTPSGMDPDSLRAIFQALPQLSSAQESREVTIEAAPGSLHRSTIDVWRECGIDRVSLGVQSFVKSELVRTGRKHDAGTVANDVRMLQNAGVRNISVDLIAGLPAQTPESWTESLQRTVDLNVTHVSVYMLEVDGDSRLGAEILRGGTRYGASDIPDEAEVAAFYEQAVAYLGNAGIHRYEISNFARPGFESRHNLKYWHREPYVGFGADAHSFDGTTRSQNVETAMEYVAHSESGTCICAEKSAAKPEEEKFFVGLRLQEGVHPDDTDWERYGTAFDRFLATGMMERSGENLRLTERGFMVSNEIFEEFLAR